MGIQKPYYESLHQHLRNENLGMVLFIVPLSYRQITVVYMQFDVSRLT